MLIKELQPDWILVRELNSGVGPRRWTRVETHVRCEKSGPLCDRIEPIARPITRPGVHRVVLEGWVGPRDTGTFDELFRAYLAASSVIGDHPEYAALTWRMADWPERSEARSCHEGATAVV